LVTYRSCSEVQPEKRAATVPALAARIGQHMEGLQQVVRQIRGTIFDLTRPPAPGLSVRAMLNSVITELTGPAQLHTTIRISALVDQLPDPMPGHTRAVVREAVSNAVHHARATELTVTVAVTDRWLLIDVTDDGTGIPADVTRRGGLRNLHGRAAQLHGTFSTTPAEAGPGSVGRCPYPPGDRSGPTAQSCRLQPASAAGLQPSAPADDEDRSVGRPHRVIMPNLATIDSPGGRQATVSAQQEQAIVVSHAARGPAAQGDIRAERERAEGVGDLRQRVRDAERAGGGDKPSVVELRWQKDRGQIPSTATRRPVPRPGGSPRPHAVRHR
jgi:hypothetical protein